MRVCSLIQIKYLIRIRFSGVNARMGAKPISPRIKRACVNWVLYASKAFDRVNHWTLFLKLIDRCVPLFIVSLLVFWYHTCQPQMTKTTDTFRVRFVITPNIPRGFDNLMVTRIISYYNILTHNMLHFPGIKKSF